MFNPRRGRATKRSQADTSRPRPSLAMPIPHNGHRCSCDGALPRHTPWATELRCGCISVRQSCPLCEKPLRVYIPFALLPSRAKGSLHCEMHSGASYRNAPVRYTRSVELPALTEPIGYQGSR